MKEKNDQSRSDQPQLRASESDQRGDDPGGSMQPVVDALLQKMADGPGYGIEGPHDECRAAREQGKGWQPMDSAPKDQDRHPAMDGTLLRSAV